MHEVVGEPEARIQKVGTLTFGMHSGGTEPFDLLPVQTALIPRQTLNFLHFNSIQIGARAWQFTVDVGN
jgi:hypothetical protein